MSQNFGLSIWVLDMDVDSRLFSGEEEHVELTIARKRWSARWLAANRNVDAVLRRPEWSRGPDRWSMIAATNILAQSFTWEPPGLSAARGMGLAALQALGPLKSALARQLMFGSR